METENHTTYKITEDIQLDENEKEIFDIFANFVAEKDLKTTIRVAGGWVRDKVLGKESSDIDFAIDNMMGEEFVKLAHASLKEKANVRGFGVTKFNPDKSKHLETATIQIKDTWIDVVNLRGETYGSNSRIPEITVGTPEQDALRRDLTINALFYNIHTGKIEDFTGQGLSDMQNGIARTPLPPDQTFIDDPLRIMRVVRFVSRFDLTMDENIVESLKQPNILDGLRLKVSKERIGVEAKLMLTNPNAFRSIQLFNQFNLLPYIIEIPETCFELAKDLELTSNCFARCFQLCEILHRFLEFNDNFPFLKTIRAHFQMPDIRFYVYLSTLLEPFGRHKVEIRPKPQKFEPLVEHLIKHSLKLTNNDASITSLAVTVKEQFRVLVKDLNNGKDILVRTAKVIKEMKQWGHTWELPFIVALVSDVAHVPVSPDQQIDPKMIVGLYEVFYKYIFDNNLNEVFNLKSLIDGAQVQQLFPGTKGPIIQTIKDNVFYWQIENPTKTVEELKEYIAAGHQEEFQKDQFEF